MSRPVDYAALTEKFCSRCEQTKPVAAFNRYTDPTAPVTGWRYYAWCRDCSNDRSRKYGTENRPQRNARLRRWRQTNPETARAHDRRKRLASCGLTEQEADALFDRFGGLCWLCRTRPARAIDHDHRTNRVRGALCDGCNSVVVARADADPGYLARVAAYVQEGGAPCHADVLLEIANERKAE